MSTFIAWYRADTAHVLLFWALVALVLLVLAIAGPLLLPMGGADRDVVGVRVERPAPPEPEVVPSVPRSPFRRKREVAK